MKRLISLLCTISVLCTMCLMVPASAAGTTLTVDTVSVNVGDAVTSVDVPIILSGNSGICGMSFRVSYDTALTLTALTVGDALSTLDYTKPKTLDANPLKLLWDGVDNDYDNGEVIVLTFDVPTNKSGEYAISLSYDAGDIYNGDMDDVDVSCVAGKINVTETSTEEEVTISTVDGAQIRATGVQGLRFISSIEKTAAFDRVVEFGTILIPSADISDISELVIDATLNGHKVAKVPAVYLSNETEETATFTAVIINIKEANYTRAYTARSYAILDDGSVVYGEGGSSRSIYEVAKNGLSNADASAADKAVFRAIVDVVEG